MKFEELKRNVKAIISNDSNYSPLEEKEVDKIKSYGKAYFMFEEKVGDTPKDFMVIEDKIQLEHLYDYLIAGYEKDDACPSIATFDNLVIDKTKCAVIFDIFISNAISNKKRSKEQLDATRMNLAELLSFIAKQDKKILSNSAYRLIDLDFEHGFENCRIFLEEKP